MPSIEGIAKRYDGSPVDYVSIFNWSDGKCLAQVVPDALGKWSHVYTKDLTVGITYVSNGCEPITHGAYDFDFVGAKYWRLSNIKDRSTTGDYIAAAELHFYNSNMENLSINPSKAFSGPTYSLGGVDHSAARAFDNNPNTWSGNIKNEPWFIGYEFIDPVLITSIGVQGRNDLPSGLGREWQTADVEVSDDGITWRDYGSIAPNVGADVITMVVVPIV